MELGPRDIVSKSAKATVILGILGTFVSFGLFAGFYSLRGRISVFPFLVLVLSIAAILAGIHRINLSKRLAERRRKRESKKTESP